MCKWYRPPIPGVRHSHGPGFGVRVRVRRTVGMADPGNGGPEPCKLGVGEWLVSAVMDILW